MRNYWWVCYQCKRTFFDTKIHAEAHREVFEHKVVFVR
jgi:hypothetical protein